MKKHRKALLVLAVFLLLGAVSAVQERSESSEGQGKVLRGEEGSDSRSQTFTYDSEGETHDLTVDISSYERPPAEAKKLLETAVEEWERVFPGSNASAEAVRENLNLPETLCDGLVSVTYLSSDYDLLDGEGNVFPDSLPETGAEVELTAEFSYGAYTREEVRRLRILPPEKGSRDWLTREVEHAVREAETASRGEREFALPRSVAGHEIYWEPVREHRWCYFIVLGMAAAFCLEYREREAGKKARKKREETLLFEYPQMVEQMALLLGSGMTIRSAWEKVLAADAQAGRDFPGGRRLFAEEMRITYREIREGCGEREAYERFGRRIGLIPYRRFASILAQNLSKGTRDVRELLTEEARVALDLRKNQARRLGEEAGTKLIFPMLLMFVLILAVLLLPAVQNF